MGVRIDDLVSESLTIEKRGRLGWSLFVNDSVDQSSICVAFSDAGLSRMGSLNNPKTWPLKWPCRANNAGPNELFRGPVCMLSIRNVELMPGINIR